MVEHNRGVQLIAEIGQVPLEGGRGDFKAPKKVLTRGALGFVQHCADLIETPSLAHIFEFKNYMDSGCATSKKSFKVCKESIRVEFLPMTVSSRASFVDSKICIKESSDRI